MGKSIYELTGEWVNMYALADEPDMDEESWFGIMEAIEEDIEAKAENTLKLCKNIDADALELEARAEAFKKEADRITALAEQKRGLIARLKKNIEGAMIATGKTKFKTDSFSVWIQKNTPSVRIDDAVDVSKVPNELLRFKAPEIDKKKVKEALERGETFEWATLEQTEGLRTR